MKRTYMTLAALGLAAALAACGEKETAPPAAPAEGSGGMMEPGTPMMKEGEMPMMKDGQMPMGAAAPAAGKTAKGEGEVTAIDKTAGTITLKHGPIAEANWPAMTMSFKANPPALLDTVKVGDQVLFDLKLEGNEVTAIQRK